TTRAAIDTSSAAPTFGSADEDAALVRGAELGLDGGEDGFLRVACCVDDTSGGDQPPAQGAFPKALKEALVGLAAAPAACDLGGEESAIGLGIDLGCQVGLGGAVVEEGGLGETGGGCKC
ncbi:MAG: hypothetical protein ACK55Z_20295, partial [bacterium]